MTCQTGRVKQLRVKPVKLAEGEGGRLQKQPKYSGRFRDDNLSEKQVSLADRQCLQLLRGIVCVFCVVHDAGAADGQQHMKHGHELFAFSRRVSGLPASAVYTSLRTAMRTTGTAAESRLPKRKAGI